MTYKVIHGNTIEELEDNIAGFIGAVGSESKPAFVGGICVTVEYSEYDNGYLKHYYQAISVTI